MSFSFTHPLEWILAAFLIFSSLGVICARKPVHASLSFLLTLFLLAIIYLQLGAEFIAVMQVLVYAGAILVIFMYVVVLFQDAYLKIPLVKPQSSSVLTYVSATVFLITALFLGSQFVSYPVSTLSLPEGFGTVESIGHQLYVDFFFPFEAVIILFLIAVVGAVYTAKKGY